jgi:hypothetical protein
LGHQGGTVLEQHLRDGLLGYAVINR